MELTTLFPSHLTCLNFGPIRSPSGRYTSVAVFDNDKGASATPLCLMRLCRPSVSLRVSLHFDVMESGNLVLCRMSRVFKSRLNLAAAGRCVVSFAAVST